MGFRLFMQLPAQVESAQKCSGAATNRSNPARTTSLLIAAMPSQQPSRARLRHSSSPARRSATVGCSSSAAPVPERSVTAGRSLFLRCSGQLVELANASQQLPPADRKSARSGARGGQRHATSPARHVLPASQPLLAKHGDPSGGARAQRPGLPGRRRCISRQQQHSVAMAHLVCGPRPPLSVLLGPQLQPEWRQLGQVSGWATSPAALFALTEANDQLTRLRSSARTCSSRVRILKPYDADSIMDSILIAQRRPAPHFGRNRAVHLNGFF